MSKVGTVERDIVLKVLKHHEVNVSHQKGGPPGMFVLSKDEINPEAQYLYIRVSRRMLKYLSRRFDIPLTDFDNPPTEIDGQRYLQ